MANRLPCEVDRCDADSSTRGPVAKHGQWIPPEVAAPSHPGGGALHSPHLQSHLRSRVFRFPCLLSHSGAGFFVFPCLPSHTSVSKLTSLRRPVSFAASPRFRL